MLQGLFELVVVEQSLSQRILSMQVARRHVGGALIGGDGLLGLLQLVVGSAQRELHFGGAVVQGNVLNHLGGMLQVAALRVKASQVEYHFL